MTPAEIFAKCHDWESIDPACPALLPPDGQIPLDPNAYTIYPIALGLGVTFSVLVGISIILRVFTRSYIMRVFRLEDVMIGLAAIGFFISVGLTLTGFSHGFGKHQWNVTVGDLFQSLHLIYIIQIIYSVTIFLAKLGILLQIQHIFTGQKKSSMYWASWVLMALVTAAYISITFILAFPCTPIRRAWHPLLPGTCNDKARPGIFSGVVNLVTDIAILALPIVSVFQLQLSLKKKLAVSAVFAIGLLACVISALRLYYSVIRTRSEDFTYWLAVVGTCGLIELAIVVICGCFPTFPRFYTFIAKDSKMDSKYGSYGAGYARSNTRLGNQGNTGVSTVPRTMPGGNRQKRENISNVPPV
ncbi:hypothetical protein P280DRAFT_544619 [Massarina eburnea CBS 473.64]|uniref:Rhodopsin domain-containing protein n=1 Tax=Massarina eburnea CBS 473.64 TaxID=1395130 RepID=A0A6A6SEG7_9PLEO|nr:hypothetical protein P280DRAFT_544619 [Massarina eburnea CBS 473.64]